jgi:hypothetical protein
MENAQTLGLYSPSSANGGGRFSRFDRGTSAQQNDEQYGNHNVAPNTPMAPFGHSPARSSASTAARQSRDRPPDQPGQPSPAKSHFLSPRLPALRSLSLHTRDDSTASKTTKPGDSSRRQHHSTVTHSTRALPTPSVLGFRLALWHAAPEVEDPSLNTPEGG